jgi:hypothetical protein
VKIPKPPRIPDAIMRLFPVKGAPKPFWMTPLDWALFTVAALGVALVIPARLAGPSWHLPAVLTVTITAVAWEAYRSLRAIVRQEQILRWQFEPLSRDDMPRPERDW